MTSRGPPPLGPPLPEVLESATELAATKRDDGVGTGDPPGCDRDHEEIRGHHLAYLIGQEPCARSVKAAAAAEPNPSREVYTNADWDESIRFLTTWAQTRSDIVRAQVAADRAKRGVR